MIKSNPGRDVADNFYSYFADEHRDRERADLLKTYITNNKDVFSQDQIKIKALLSKEDSKNAYIKFLKDVLRILLTIKFFKLLETAI